MCVCEREGGRERERERERECVRERGRERESVCVCVCVFVFVCVCVSDDTNWKNFNCQIKNEKNNKPIPAVKNQEAQFLFRGKGGWGSNPLDPLEVSVFL